MNTGVVLIELARNFENTLSDTKRLEARILNITCDQCSWCIIKSQNFLKNDK